MIVILILAILQGLTEFLPVSSSGHLVLLSNIFGLDSSSKMLSIVLHVATLFSVLVYYRKDILMLIKHPLCKTNKKLLLTTLVTCLLVLIIKPIIDTLFTGKYLFVFFLITAILLYVSDYITYRRFKTETGNMLTKTNSITTNILDLNISYKASIVLGVTQAIACIPGISRSGSTISVARCMGIKNDATKYSFLMSIPIIVASLIMEILDGGNIGQFSILEVGIGCTLCFVVGLVSIKIMTNFVSRNKLSVFSYYLITLSALLVFGII